MAFGFGFVFAVNEERKSESYSTIHPSHGTEVRAETYYRNRFKLTVLVQCTGWDTLVGMLHRKFNKGLNGQQWPVRPFGPLFHILWFILHPHPVHVFP